MAKMNWDRVRDWDRVHFGMSDMEIADERDERWFELERERELQREARLRGAPGRAPKRSTSPATGPLNPSRASCSPTTPKARAGPKSPRRPASPPLKPAVVCRRLDVTAAQLSTARRAEERASTGLGGLTKKERQRRVATRLRITPDELKLLRQVLGGNLNGSLLRAAMLIRQVAASSAVPSSTTSAARRTPDSFNPKTKTSVRQKKVKKPSNYARRQTGGPPVH